MNVKQKKIFIAAAAAIALSGVFAPMHVKNPHIQYDCGYRLINFPTKICSIIIEDGDGNLYYRSGRAEINISTLAIEWLGIMIIAGLLFVSTKE